MGAQQNVFTWNIFRMFQIKIKSVLHVPGRMVLPDIQAFKIIIIAFNLRTKLNVKTKPKKNIFDLSLHQSYRMQMANLRLNSRNSMIEFFCGTDAYRFFSFNNFRFNKSLKFIQG